MAVISISIEESSEQIVSGIPKNITVTTNMPSVIFYTLDGSTPTLFSNIYTGPIYLPKDKPQVIFSAFANNGTESSVIITETYITNVLNNTRLAHSATDGQIGTDLSSLYPYGTNFNQPNSVYLNPADAGVTVNDPNLPVINNGFDGDGNPNAGSNQIYNTENYHIKYSTTNSLGETGPNIGNLPGKVEIDSEAEDPESTEQFTTTFNPKAFVIFQDLTKEDPNDPAQINRQHFMLEDDSIRDGNLYFNSGLDSAPVSGSFVRHHYNPRTNMMTYYYFDSWANKWIISTQPYTNNNTNETGLIANTSGRGNGSRYVFEWMNFTRRVLF